MAQSQTQKALYDEDFVAWLDDTIFKLKHQRFEEIDLENLIEEIGGLAKRDRRELRNRLEVLLSHLLKRLYVNSSNDYRAWEATIREQRRQLRTLLEQSPSLKKYWVEIFPVAWQSALSDTQEEYLDAQFPERWDLNSEIDNLLNEKFWSEDQR
ncbi:MAG: DUF29 domain-containing protein [Leptolyngbya sp. Prado105]|jgi:hypothetical protein|nr:DUF29 domain-containing protein [Leptolyngbya sp. Prado105]